MKFCGQVLVVQTEIDILSSCLYLFLLQAKLEHYALLLWGDMFE